MRCHVLDALNLGIKSIQLGPDLFNLLLIGLLLIHSLVIICTVICIILHQVSILLILFQLNVDVLHLQLVVTLVAHSLERFLTASVDFGFEVQDDLAVLLLSVNVVLLLFLPGLEELLTFPARFFVLLEILLIHSNPVLGHHLDCCSHTIDGLGKVLKKEVGLGAF